MFSFVNMFNLGFSELMLLGLLALLLIGPKQLPDVARALGRFINEMRRNLNIFKDQLNPNHFPLERTIDHSRQDEATKPIETNLPEKTEK
jgi:Tat protein translocase TatB subunit